MDEITESNARQIVEICRVQGYARFEEHFASMYVRAELRRAIELLGGRRFPATTGRSRLLAEIESLCK